MSDSTIQVHFLFQVFGALRMSVKMLLMWNSRMVIDGGRDSGVATSLLEGSNLIVLRVRYWPTIVSCTPPFTCHYLLYDIFVYVLVRNHQ